MFFFRPEYLQILAAEDNLTNWDRNSHLIDQIREIINTAPSFTHRECRRIFTNGDVNLPVDSGIAIFSLKPEFYNSNLVFLLNLPP